MTKMHTINVKKITDMSSMNINDPFQEPVWSNKHFVFVFDGKPMFLKNWIKSNILYVKDKFTDNGFKSLDEISDEVYKKANLLCEYKIRSSAFKYIWNIVDGIQAKFSLDETE